MSRTVPRLPLLLVALLGIAAWSFATNHATPPSPALQRRIDALLKHRLKPELLPINPPNPFQLPGAAQREFSADDLASKPAVSNESGTTPGTTPADSTQPRDIPGSSNAEVLIGCATRLKLGGILILKEQIQIVVNGVPRKEGDLIAAEWHGTIVYLRIARLLPGHMVLRYGEAEATVKF